jgi:hypothetical protein
VDNRTELAAGFLSRLKSILSPQDILTQPENRYLIVEPGLTNQEVQAIAGSTIRTGY